MEPNKKTDSQGKSIERTIFPKNATEAEMVDMLERFLTERGVKITDETPPSKEAPAENQGAES